MNVPVPFDIVFAVVNVNTVTAIFRSSGRDLFYLRRFTALVARPSQSLKGECHERRWILAKQACLLWGTKQPSPGKLIG
ncbi:hypothetical protein QEV60_03440 [Trueperella pyogenes]|uniref:hypothetical protein n=1 Tax=Trueperella pyogenes TaxID=1661 RepID=UPI003132D01F